MPVRCLFTLVLSILLLLSSPVCGGGFPTIHGWDNTSGDDLWGTGANWTTNEIPGSNDPAIERILLAGTSAAGPQTIDLGGVTRQIKSIEADGVDTTGGSYTFENGTIELLITGANNAILTDQGGGSLTFDSDIRFGTGTTQPRFNVTPLGEQIVVNGTVAPADTNSTAVTLELTSRNLTLDPSVTITGVISDGTSSTLALTAGFRPDAENHRGVVRVTGNNTYTGKTIVNGAVLEIDTLNNLGVTSALGAPTSVANGTIRLGAVDASSGVHVPGTLRFIGSTNAQTNRGLELVGAGGVLDLTNRSLQLSGNIDSISSSTKTLHLHSDTAPSRLSGLISNTSGVLGIEQVGKGTWEITGLNTYTGPTSIERSFMEVNTLRNAGQASSLGRPTGANATINISGSIGPNLGGLVYTGTGDTTNRTFSIAGSSGITSSGSGPLVLTAPTMTVAAGSATLAASLDLDGTNQGANEIRSAIPDVPGSVKQTLSKRGSGTWILSGNNTYVGGTDFGFNSGVLKVNNTSGSGTGSGDVRLAMGSTLGGTGRVAGVVKFFTGGTVAPDLSESGFEVGGVNFTSQSTFAVDIGGTQQGAQYDFLDVAGSATLAGTLDVTLADLGGGTFAPSLGNSFTILSATGSVSGTFATTAESLPPLAAGLRWEIATSASNVTLNVLEAITGDFDFDGDVDGADFLKWQRGGSPSSLSASDLADWEANFGTAPPLSATSNAVPELGTIVLFALAFGILFPAHRLSSNLRRDS